MKKLLVLFVALSAFTFTSCSDDDDLGNSIVGKWYLHSVTYEGKTKVKEYECKNKDYTEFTSNGKITEYRYDVENECKKEIEIEGTYVFKDNKLTITHSDGSEIYNCTIKGDEMNVNNKDGDKMLFKRLK